MLERLLFEPAPLDTLCPERREFTAEQWLDRYGSLLVGRLARRWLTRPTRRRLFLRSVNAHAEEIGACDDRELARRARAVGLDMRRQGLHDAGLAEAFALIREIATRRLGMRRWPPARARR